MNKPATIREEKTPDIPLIRAIHDRAFDSRDEGVIVEKLRKNKNLTISLVAEVEGVVIGHIAYSPVYINGTRTGLGLAPVAVLPAHQNQGTGSALIRTGNEIAVMKGFSMIFVLGDPDYYSRFGFELAREYNYFSKFDPGGKHFMILRNKIKVAEMKLYLDYGAEFNE